MNEPIPTDADPLYRLLWLCYAAGRNDAGGASLLEMDPRDAAIVDVIRHDWRARMSAERRAQNVEQETTNELA